MRVVINVCFGGFEISDAAYDKLIEWGVPVCKYTEQERGPDGLWLPQPANEGEVIFDRELYDDPIYQKYKSRVAAAKRYWDAGWLRDRRNHPLLLRLIDEMGEAANGPYSELKVVEIPDGTEYEIDEYDGNETINEKHRSWR